MDGCVGVLVGRRQDDVREGYVPKQRELLDAIVKERQRQSKLIDEGR